MHGAIILGSHDLRNYLINFARSFIYTTALPEVNTAYIRASYQLFPTLNKERAYLSELIGQMQNSKCKIQSSKTPIQAVIISGNEEVKIMAEQLQRNNLDVRAILYPTVPKGRERLRIVLHSFNTANEVNKLLDILKG